MPRPFVTPPKILLALLVLFSAVLACARALSLSSEAFRPSAPQATAPIAPAEATPNQPSPRSPSVPAYTPTPDPPHDLPDLPSESERYIVQSGDTLNQIAERYSVSVEMIVQENNLTSADYIEAGQTLIIPIATPLPVGLSFKVIPDSELVFGPLSAQFDTADFIQSWGGYLASYQGEVDSGTLSGAQIVARIAREYSVNPRLLLAVLEYQSGWVTQPNPPETTHDYPMGVAFTYRKGLYRQLAWAADNLNRGFYLWRVNGLATWTLRDGSVIQIAPTLNAGTAGVQYFFSQLYGLADWEKAVSADGLFATFDGLFGYPFDFTFEPLLPAGLTQPVMQLPFEPGVTWAFTGGPHGGWGSGSGWAALDFAPPGRPLGCVPSDAWAVAVSDGLIVRSENGAVVQDLDGDGLEQTGWTVLYMHVEARERVAAGAYLHAGERVGHPSCEGGVSTGTHVHLARRFNGEWIPADQDLPFVLDGWVSVGLGREYDGFLQKDSQTVSAMEGRFPENSIGR